MKIKEYFQQTIKHIEVESHRNLSDLRSVRRRATGERPPGGEFHQTDPETARYPYTKMFLSFKYSQNVFTFKKLKKPEMSLKICVFIF